MPLWRPNSSVRSALAAVTAKPIVVDDTSVSLLRLHQLSCNYLA